MYWIPLLSVGKIFEIALQNYKKDIYWVVFYCEAITSLLLYTKKATNAGLVAMLINRRCLDDTSSLCFYLVSTLFRVAKKLFLIIVAERRPENV